MILFQFSSKIEHVDKLFLKNFAEKASYNIYDLITLVRILRNPDYGCSWDREQTHHSVRHNFVEEVYEVLDAIDSGNAEMLREELGDTLLQVCLHTEMEYEKNNFNFDDVCDGICKKLIFRHPHVFSDTVADSTDEVLKNWEDLKRSEKGQSDKAAAVEGIARSLPALMYSKKLHKQLFDKTDSETALRNIAERTLELGKIIEAKEDSSDAIGKLLFDVVALARTEEHDPEIALMSIANEYKNKLTGKN